MVNKIDYNCIQIFLAFPAVGLFAAIFFSPQRQEKKKISASIPNAYPKY
jgi:hypothetical protein